MFKKLSELLIKYGLIPFVYYLIRLYFLTLRIKIVGEEGLLRDLEGGGRAIAAIWHQRLFLIARYAPRLKDYRAAAIISQSRDGELIAQFLKLLNIRPIRGSSSRGGITALKAILKDLNRHPLAGHAIDGPRGPRWIIKPGLIFMAKLSQGAIYPLYASVDRAWELNSWDRFLIPKPFSRLLIYWDEPLYVPREISQEELDKIRLQTEGLMRKKQEDLDEKWRTCQGGEIAP